MISTQEKEQVSRLNDAIEFKRRRIRRLERLSKGRDQDFWAALKEEIEFSVNTSKNSLDALAEGFGAPHNDGPDDFRSLARFYGGQQIAYKGILQNVESSQQKIDRLNEEISNHQDEIKRIRGNAVGNKTARERETSVV